MEVSFAIGNCGIDTVLAIVVLTQFENGDKCTLLSLVDGKAIAATVVIMAQAGSRFKTKIVPRDWYIVKIVSAISGEEDCPLTPYSVNSQVVTKIKDVVNKIVLWPNSHIAR